MSIEFYVVSCPCGEAEFPVDPAKVPEGGVHARCSLCSGVFRVELPRSAGSGAGGVAVLEAPAEAPPSAPFLDDAAGAVDGYYQPGYSGTGAPDGAGAAFAGEPEEMLEISGPPGDEVGFHLSVDLPPPPPPAPASPGEVVFGRRDPHDKARRLARVLVSDMITYHRDRHARAAAAGTLAEDFDEEIRKSWEEYVMQVGRGLAEDTTYFRDALNEILAGGQELF